MKNNKGFSIVEAILIIIIIAVIGFVVWRAFDMLSIANKTQTQTQQTDLNKVETTLNSTNIDGTESSQLNSETNF